ELIDLRYALVNAAFDPARLEIEREREAADPAANKRYFHRPACCFFNPSERGLRAGRLACNSRDTAQKPSEMDEINGSLSTWGRNSASHRANRRHSWTRQSTTAAWRCAA